MTTTDVIQSDFSTIELSHRYAPETFDHSEYGVVVILNKCGHFPASETRLFFQSVEELDRLIAEAQQLRGKWAEAILEEAAEPIRYPVSKPVEENHE